MYAFSFGQVIVPKLENSSEDKIFTNDPVIKSLIHKSNVILMYRKVNHTIPNSEASYDFNVVNLQPNGRWNYYKLKQGKNKKILVGSKVSQDTLKQIYQAFIDNDLFGLKTSLQITDTCSRDLIGGGSYEFRILTQLQYKQLDYYMPEYYEQYCPGNRERQKIIKCAKSIFKLKDIR